MAQKIRVLIVDDFAETRESLARLLRFERDIAVVGMAADGSKAIELTRQLGPDIVLMDINMPGIDGIRATEILSREVPSSQVIIISVQGEADYLRRAMLAGARDFLTKPFTSDELASTIRRVFEMSADRRQTAALSRDGQSQQVAANRKHGKVICVFSPKGGVGRSTLAVNMAVALRQLTQRSVALIDANLQFGDVAVMLNLEPNRTIHDLLNTYPEITSDVLRSTMVEHESGVSALLAPARPEYAELFQPDHLRVIVQAVARQFDYVLVDTWTSFHEIVLTIFDLSDQIVLLATLELTAVKNIRMFLDVCQALGYRPDKIALVLNRADSTGAISVQDIEERLHHRVSATLVSAGHLVTESINRGVPFVLSHPEAPISRNIFDVARLVATPEDLQQSDGRLSTDEESARSGFRLGRLRVFARRGGV